MIASITTGLDPLSLERMVVVGDRSADGELCPRLRERFPEWTVTKCESYLSAIADLCRQPARIVIAWVDSSAVRMGDAVAGLREAAGAQTKLVLCCGPDQEPAARRLLAEGADDYLLYPLDHAELDSVLGCKRVDAPAVDNDPSASPEELAELAKTLAAFTESPRSLLDRISSMIQTNLRARSATVVVEGAVSTSGESAGSPVLSAAIAADGGVLGNIGVTERIQGAYSARDAARLEAYAGLAAQILSVASAQRRWRRLALTDECTGLPNRRYLLERMRSVLDQAAKECLPVTLLLFDIDNFKAYNDVYGHEAGDEVLRLAGQLFRRHCREQDIVTRYGGDEFAVVFWDPEGPRVAGSKHPDCALAVLERFREALRNQALSLIPPGVDAQLTISGGLATYPWAGNSFAGLLRSADAALLAAKRSGRNRILHVGQPDEPEPSGTPPELPTHL